MYIPLIVFAVVMVAGIAALVFYTQKARILEARKFNALK
jgi:hypothetical protein